MTAEAEYHRLLVRQLAAARKASPSLDLRLLLSRVSQAYEEHDEVRRIHERAAFLISEEMLALNAQIEAESAAHAHARDRLQAVLDHASEAIVSIDADFRIISFNNAAMQLFGLAPEVALGQSAVDLLVASWPAGAMETTPPGKPIVAVGRHASGRLFDAEVSLSRLVHGEHVIITGFWRDISARKAQEAAMIAMRDAADAANRAKSQFLATMSHELRTPLNGVLGMAQALSATALDAEQRRMLRVLSESGESLLTLLSDILDLSKIEAGQMSFETAPFDLGGACQTVHQLFAETAAAKDVRCELEVAASARGWFEGDPTRFRQVLQNLVSNAIKFTAEGFVRMGVEASPQPDGRRRIRVAVQDSGIGVSPEACARLFEAFKQADSTTTRRFGGTGLGLAICRQLVEGMGGEIGVESELGRGSCFWFEIPMAPAAPQLCELGRAPASPPPQTCRILVAEDNAVNRQVLSALLKQVEVDLSFVEDGRTAVERARDEEFDVILMDVHMPHMDGFDAARAIRALPGPRGATPIIALTADAFPEQIAACRAAGMDAHVAKPFRPETLFTTIAAVLQAREPPKDDDQGYSICASGAFDAPGLAGRISNSSGGMRRPAAHIQPKTVS